VLRMVYKLIQILQQLRVLLYCVSKLYEHTAALQHVPLMVYYSYTALPLLNTLKYTVGNAECTALATAHGAHV
jgi:hypothetical protein